MERGEAEALEKAWLEGWEEGDTPKSGRSVYVDEDDSESYFLTPDRNGDDVSLIGT